jgi:mono/diheme cytochrome c family protein
MISIRPGYWLAIAYCILLTLTFAMPVDADGPNPDYLRDVRPILADNCFRCHGADEQSREAGLRLDVREAGVHGGESGDPAIVPGKPDVSQLIRRITSRDESERMPPPDAKSRLTSSQVETLRKWIANGALYQVHWAMVPPCKPPVPAASDTHWEVNEIDNFVLSRLRQEQLSPSAEATRTTLLRRLFLDSIGLPPSPKEVTTFLADASPGAYERQVDKLLASEHFGEKWARHWLDVARYADSDGYEKDLPRKQYLWRDWVIDAINRDMPYNQFIIEQVAGDLLPNATQSQRVATGFLRNGMVNEEGAIIHEQFRMEGLFDRLDCLGKSVLGLTIQCAQCHSHKFDPISQTEYYRLLAFLNDDYEAISWVYTDEQLTRIATVERDVRKLEAKLKTKHPDWQSRFAEWEVKTKKEADAWTVLEPIDPEFLGGLAHPQALPDRSVLTLGFRPEGGDLVVMSTTKMPRVTGLRLDALTHGDLPFGGPGRSQRGTFALSEIFVEAQQLGKPNATWEKVKVTDAVASFAQEKQTLGEPWRRSDKDTRVVGPANYLVDGKDDTAWGADRGPGRRHQDLAANLRFEKPVSYPDGTRFKITLRFQHGGADAHGRTNNFLGRFRLSITDNDKSLQPLPHFVTESLNIPAERRSEQQNEALFNFWRETDPSLAEGNAAISKLWSDYPEGETVLNLAARKPEHYRQTAILERGNWQKPTTAVTPGVPAALHALPQDAPPNRLTLARWLVDRRSPTTARVEVNRVWQSVFGIGIVETAEDFGVRASPPSHPELLDWLAIDFMDHDWSLKHLLRTVVTSATYHQESRFTNELLDRDPKNRLLARGPRFRVEAEVARDTVLAASGLLNPKRGGPSFFPPVPESLFATSYIPAADFWMTASGSERYRRSLYIFRRRSMPDPVLASLDAPNGDFSCARRTRSNTPLAALSTLNESVFVDSARALALRVLREAAATDRDRVDYAFKLCLNRVPSPAERDEVMSLYQSQHKRLADGWISSRAIATGSHETLPDLPKGISPTDAAAWTVVARVLLNLDETLSKG